MSDVKGNFIFELWGTDSLAYKWVNEVRGKGALENGINLWALADYFFKTLHLDKVFSDLYGDVDGYNKFTSELKSLNSFDNEKIITFKEEIKIPVTHRIVDIVKGSASNFTQIVEKIESEETLSKKKFNELLSKDEISEFLINIYHVFNDNRSKEGITGKKYKEIIDHPYLYFGSNSKLSFLVPTSIKMKVTTSTTVEENKEIKLEENKTKPEIKKVKKVVFIDAGHGGTDSGNIGINKDWKKLTIKNNAERLKYYENGVLNKESDIVLKYASKLKSLLTDEGIIVEMTRSSDSTTSLSSRSSFVNTKLKSYKADDKKIFVSIHTNAVGLINEATIKAAKITYLYVKDYKTYYYAYTSSPKTNTWVPVPKTDASGASVYIYNKSDKVHKDSKTLRNKISGKIGASEKEANYHVVRETRSIPGVLIELGFSTNLSDLKKLLDDTKRDNTCKNIKEAIVEFFK